MSAKHEPEAMKVVAAAALGGAVGGFLAVAPYAGLGAAMATSAAGALLLALAAIVAARWGAQPD